METISTLVQYWLCFLFGFVLGCAWTASFRKDNNIHMEYDSSTHN